MATFWAQIKIFDELNPIWVIAGLVKFAFIFTQVLPPSRLWKIPVYVPTNKVPPLCVIQFTEAPFKPFVAVVHVAPLSDDTYERLKGLRLVFFSYQVIYK